jgi:hypothetical protein
MNACFLGLRITAGWGWKKRKRFTECSFGVPVEARASREER